MFTLQRIVNDNSSNNKKEIIVHCVFVVCIMLWVVCQCVVTYRSNSYSNINTITKSDYIYNGEYTMSNSNGIRNLSDVNTSDNDEDSMILNIQRYIFNQVLSGRMFVGKWNANTNGSNDITTLIGGYDNGKVHLRLSSVFDLINNEEVIVLYFKCYEDNYIDNWLAVTSFTNLNELISSISYNNNASLISFNNSFITSYETGKIFTRTFHSQSPCKSTVSLSFQATPLTVTIQNIIINENKNITINTMDPSQINITFISEECGIDISIQAYNNNNNDSSLNEFIYSINIYTIIIISISILSSLSSLLLMNQLRKHESNVTAISLFTICQSFIWHSYCCLSNMNFGLNYPMYVTRFTLLSGCHMICFAIFDLRLIYTYWQILSRQLPYDIFLRKKLRFYICFYALVFSSFFMLLKAYYDKTCITVMIVTLWLPQIIFNYIRNNKVGLPLIYILICTVDRMALPLYFRGYNNNLFHIRNDISFISCICVYLCLNVCVLYVQVCCGGRFVLTKKMRRKVFEYYKSKDELLKVKANVTELDCVICLQKIIKDNEGEIKEDEVDGLNKSLINDKNEDVVVSVMMSTTNEDDFECNNRRGHKKKKKRIKWKQTMFICTNIYGILFTFYKVNKNKNNKPFMITPCGHVVHTKCLEEWFYCKKECPNCRKEMSDY